jgi:hypothetical protein
MTIFIALMIASASASDPSRKKRFLKYLIGFVLVIFLAWTAFFISQINQGGLRIDVKNEFRRHGDSAQGIIDQLRHKRFRGTRTFIMSEEGPPSDGAAGAHNKTWARRDRDGSLTVEILMDGDGQTTGYGFLYSDKPQQPIPDKPIPGIQGDFVTLDAPGPMHTALATDQIDDHWCAVRANKQSETLGSQFAGTGALTKSAAKSAQAPLYSLSALSGAVGLVLLLFANPLAPIAARLSSHSLASPIASINPLLTEAKRRNLTDPIHIRRSFRIIGIVFIIQAIAVLLVFRL